MKLDPGFVQRILTGQNRDGTEKSPVSELLHRIPPVLERRAASQTIVEFLAGLSLFAALTKKEVNQLAAFMHERSYGHGEVIFKQGNPSGALYLIRDGCLELLRTREGRERILATLGPNEYIGEVALLLDEPPRQASARSKGTSNLLAFSRPDFDTLMEHSPNLGVKVIKALGYLIAQRFRMVIEELEASLGE